MGSIKILENTVQTYAWGSRTAIAELLGKPSPAAAPWAEMWMGAHPKAPSMVHETGGAVSLIDLITANPEATLGRTTARMFDNRLPFLFKVLAAETPLSIQAHPDKVQAEQGFERENRAGIPLDAPQRNYRDTSHKPECLCALTPFFVLCGFRPVPDILEMFFLLLPEAEVVQLTPNLVNRSAPEGLRSFIMQLLHLSAGRREAVLAWAVDRAEDLVDQDPAFQWIVRLSRTFPGDIGALAPGFLNLVNLEPGQALFLPAGTLHSYLEGTGLEVMANSDNVLRGGLTAKHVDTDELSRILAFKPMVPRILRPVAVSKCERLYPTPAPEFSLSVMSITGDQPCSPANHNSAEILLCVQGEAVLCEEKGGEETSLFKGMSAFIPASAGSYHLKGDAVFYRAFVPPSSEV
ncbi:MAG: mannose-6-phosphate isomerase, class I [Thermodesulfobacteriota bacterium]